ncbi:MAG TPA: hypothetical protein VMT81_01740 [Candidatus Paceibacterota bacterium]|nr:hypothetical protein [Candidatus Paceibacterota bacterium]
MKEKESRRVVHGVGRPGEVPAAEGPALETKAAKAKQRKINQSPICEATFQNNRNIKQLFP